MISVELIQNQDITISISVCLDTKFYNLSFYATENVMTEIVTIPGILLELVESYIHNNQLDIDQVNTLLRQYKGRERIPLEVWWEILELIYEKYPVPVLGHYIGSLIEPCHINILGYLALSSPNVISFIESFKNFQPLLQNSAQFSINIEQNKFAMTWTPVIVKNSQLSNEVLISGVLKLLQNILHYNNIKPLKIEFSATKPKSIRHHEEVYGCPVSFDSDALRLWFPIDMLYLPIPTGDPYLKELLNKQAEVLLKALPNADSFLKKLQEVIVQTLNNKEPTVQNIAIQMDLSVRTFYRKLNQRGLQYSDIVKNIRKELAKNYLVETDLSLSKIAFLLGYAEQSAFSRAFKQWETLTPTEYRKSFQKMNIKL